jgi:hypothetical protein
MVQTGRHRDQEAPVVIEITPEMIEVGMAALIPYQFGENGRYVAEEVFRQMCLARKIS